MYDYARGAEAKQSDDGTADAFASDGATSEWRKRSAALTVPLIPEWEGLTAGRNSRFRGDDRPCPPLAVP